MAWNSAAKATPTRTEDHRDAEIWNQRVCSEWAFLSSLGSERETPSIGTLCPDLAKSPRETHVDAEVQNRFASFMAFSLSFRTWFSLLFVSLHRMGHPDSSTGRDMKRGGNVGCEVNAGMRSQETRRGGNGAGRHGTGRESRVLRESIHFPRRANGRHQPCPGIDDRGNRDSIRVNQGRG